MIEIYFSDYFLLSSDIMDEYGAFNVSLINDLPLFVDPFLLFNSKNDNYQQLHSEIIDYMRFLKQISLAGEIPEPLVHEWFTFPEVKQNWFGLSRSGNEGRGLGIDFARALHRNLNTVFRDFGDEVVTRGSHLEKLCLIKDGVGRDNISDFTTNLIKYFLANYTQEFAFRYLQSSQRKLFTLRKVKFNYDTRSWTTESFELPYHHFEQPYPHDDFILLTPKDILTKDEAWINRPDLINRFPEIAHALSDATLRAQVNEYLIRTIPRGPKVTRKEVHQVIGRAVELFPQVLDYYIREKENTGNQAVSYAEKRVKEVEIIFIRQVRSLVSQFLEPGGFYQIPYNTHREAYERLLFLKDVIENKGGHKLFYINRVPLEREADLQILYRLTWYATPSDVTREANDGRGPADFKISRGAADKSIVEFKLAKNTQLERNLQKQCRIYEAASDTTNPSIKAIIYFNNAEFRKVHRILKRLKLENDPNIVLIDACDDNKPSGSNA